MHTLFLIYKQNNEEDSDGDEFNQNSLDQHDQRNKQKILTQSQKNPKSTYIGWDIIVK